MSFAFHAAGTKEQAREQIDAAVNQAMSYTNPPTEIEKVAEVVKHYLDTGDYTTGVYVEANGHLDRWGGTLNVAIKPLNIQKKPSPTGE